MSDFDNKIVQNDRLQEAIEIIRKKAERYYEISVVESDEKPKIVTTYNKIEIHVGNSNDDADLWHELVHVRMLTEEGRILHPYPIDVDNANEYYLFVNTITNIVYDIFVDVELYFSNNEISEDYYRRKIIVYRTFINNNNVIRNLRKELQALINDLVQEYCKVLDDIINNRINELGKYQNKSISEQRKEIEYLLDKTIFARRYEWISYHDIYIREQRIGEK